MSGNRAHDGGGIYSAGAATSIGLRSKITITGSTIVGNAAAAPDPPPPPPGTEPPAIQTLGSGGGMVSDGEGHLVLTDVLFAGNKAGDEGGGLANGGRASMTVTRVTFDGERVERRGRRRVDGQRAARHDPGLDLQEQQGRRAGAARAARPGGSAGARRPE